jgi:hypothetical protein
VELRRGEESDLLIGRGARQPGMVGPTSPFPGALTGRTPGAYGDRLCSKEGDALLSEQEV